MAQPKDAAAPKRKEREELFPSCEDDIPRAVVTRIVKAKVPVGTIIAAEAKNAMARAGRIFLLYVAATANDICQKNGRSTVTGQDVITAIEETEFNPFLDPLNNTFQAFRAAADKKKAKAKKDGKDSERREEDIEIDEDEEDDKDDKDDDFDDE